MDNPLEARIDSKTGTYLKASAIKKLDQRIIFDPRNDELIHQLGRIYQEKGLKGKAKRAYVIALSINQKRARTLNNLGVLELSNLHSEIAEEWLSKGLELNHISSEEKALLLNSYCELKIFQLRIEEAKTFANKQVKYEQSIRSYNNLAICLKLLNKIAAALRAQSFAIKLLTGSSETDISYLPKLIGNRNTSQQNYQNMHIQLLNLAQYKLCLNPFCIDSQKLLLAGVGINSLGWEEPEIFETIWKGEQVTSLLLWDDQGFGDAIQNLSWIRVASEKTSLLKIWLRSPLIKLVQKRLLLPDNCILERIPNDQKPWKQNSPQLGLWYLPIALGGWKPAHDCLGKASLIRSCPEKHSRGIGLVWSAGKHSAAQPEWSARIRDIPFQILFNEAVQWRSDFGEDLISLQLTKDNNQEFYRALDSNLIKNGLKETDWDATARVIEKLSIVITIDTAMAHLCGALGIPCIVLLNRPCDWRWGQESTNSFLYNSVKLARCPSPGDWSGAVKKASRLVHMHYKELIT